MIQTLFIIKFIFPFVLLAIFFTLYRKPYKWLQHFYFRMAMLPSARRFYSLVLLITLIILNWCCFETDHNYAVAVSACMSVPFAFRRLAEAILLRLHDHKRFLLLTLMSSLILYTIPYMNSIFLVVYVASVAAQFYPSGKILGITKDPGFKCTKEELAMLIQQYYF